MARRNCPSGCAMGLPSGIKFQDHTQSSAKSVKSTAGLAGAKPFMKDQTHAKAFTVKNPLNGKK